MIVRAAVPVARPTAIAEIRAWLTVALAILLQLVGTIYWAATLSGDIKRLQEQVVEIKGGTADKYTGSMASRDFGAVQTTLLDHEKRLREVENAAKYRVK